MGGSSGFETFAPAREDSLFSDLPCLAWEVVLFDFMNVAFCPLVWMVILFCAVLCLVWKMYVFNSGSVTGYYLTSLSSHSTMLVFLSLAAEQIVGSKSRLVKNDRYGENVRRGKESSTRGCVFFPEAATGDGKGSYDKQRSSCCPIGFSKCWLLCNGKSRIDQHRLAVDIDRRLLGGLGKGNLLRVLLVLVLAPQSVIVCEP